MYNKLYDICQIMRDWQYCDLQTWESKWTLSKGSGDGLFPC